MKKRKQLIYNWSIIILNIALFFIPHMCFKTQDGNLQVSSLFLGILNSIANIDFYIMYELLSNLITSYTLILLYIILCILSIVFVFKKSNIKALHLLPVFYIFLESVIYFSSGALPFVGFAISALVVVAYLVYLVYFINQKTNFISKLNNRQRKPTNKERIAQLEKELQELKNKSN